MYSDGSRKEEKMNLKDKVAIITGSSRGIGRAIAEKMAEKGAKVVICSTKDQVAKEVAQTLANTYGVQTLGMGVDVTNEEQVKALVSATMDTFGRVDCLVNNAGITKDNLLLRLSSDEWDQVINTNLKSVYLCSKAVLRPMMKQKSGKIIHIASVVGVIGNPGQTNYAASKGGMIAFSKSLAREYSSKGIISNVVAPGFVETEMIEGLPKDYLDNIIQSIPLGRLGKDSEIANLVSFLASDESGYMTGQVLNIDGGMAM